MAGTSELERRVEEALYRAMKARDTARVSALRNIRARLQNRAIEKRAPLEDADVIGVLSTLAKQRRESIEQFRAGGRDDLVAKEEAELRVIQEFLPAQMDEAQLREAVAVAIREVGATGPGDLGKVMGVLMPRVRGRADGKRVSALAREMLAGRDES